MYASRSCAASVDCSACTHVLRARLLGSQFRAAPLRGEFGRVQLVQTLSLRGNHQLGFTNARAQGVALLEVGTDAIRQLGDPRAHRRESGFRSVRVRRVLRFGGCGRAAGAQQRRGGGRAQASNQPIHSMAFMLRPSIQALRPLLYLRARKSHTCGACRDC